MKLLLKIAYRNMLRNLRRSLMTGSAVAAGALALLLFGGFAAYIFAGLETNNVQRIGHLTVFREGYFLLGAGNPAAYGIDHYREVMQLIEHDPVVGPMISVITPTQSLVGIAGNFSGSVEASKTFLGTGLIPSDRERMRQWDEFGASVAATCRIGACPMKIRRAVSSASDLPGSSGSAGRSACEAPVSCQGGASASSDETVRSSKPEPQRRLQRRDHRASDGQSADRVSPRSISWRQLPAARRTSCSSTVGRCRAARSQGTRRQLRRDAPRARAAAGVRTGRAQSHGHRTAAAPQ